MLVLDRVARDLSITTSSCYMNLPLHVAAAQRRLPFGRHRCDLWVRTKYAHRLRLGLDGTLAGITACAGGRWRDGVCPMGLVLVLRSAVYTCRTAEPGHMSSDRPARGPGAGVATSAMCVVMSQSQSKEGAMAAFSKALALSHSFATCTKQESSKQT